MLCTLYTNPYHQSQHPPCRVCFSKVSQSMAPVSPPISQAGLRPPLLSLYPSLLLYFQYLGNIYKACTWTLQRLLQITDPMEWLQDIGRDSHTSSDDFEVIADELQAMYQDPDWMLNVGIQWMTAVIQGVRVNDNWIRGFPHNATTRTSRTSNPH